MKEQEMKIISEHLIDALNKEDLHTRDAARALNLNPAYISMAKNPKSWNSISKDAWYRLWRWHNNRLKITEFKIPADEPIVNEPASAPEPEPVTKRKYTKRQSKEPIDIDSWNPPDPPGKPLKETVHQKVCFDIEINLVVNGQKVKMN